MEKIFIITVGVILAIVFVAVLVGCRTRGGILDGPGMENSYEQIDQEKAKEMMKKDDGHVTVDVRRRDEYDAGHIPGAILIPNESIGTEKPAELPDTDQIILIYCRSGRRSKEAAQKLFNMGYTKVYEFGGIIDWTGDVVKDAEISFVSEAVDADVWFLPETDENLKTTLWGKATIPGATAGEPFELTVSVNASSGAAIFRAIDGDKTYYSANGIALENGYSVRLGEDDDFSYFIEIVDAEGNDVGKYPVFTAKL